MAEPGAPGWLDELDLHVGPPVATMGTRALDLDRWFLLDEEWESQRACAAEVLGAAPADVLVGESTPQLVAAAGELHDVVSAWLSAPASAGPEPSPAPERSDVLSVLAATRLLVADDLCLLLPGDQGWELAAGCVCFPSYWHPAERIGRPLPAVHAAVPGYPGDLAGRVDRFLDRLRPGQGVWRRNWLVHDVADLHLPRWLTGVDRPTPVPDGRWLRSERQTLVRLPTAEAVVFTIRTQQVPAGALRSRPEVAHGIAAAIRGWSDDQRAYKGGAVDDALVTWLEGVTAPG